MGSRLAYYTRGPNPVFFCQDSDKLTTNSPLEPSLYTLFEQTLLERQNAEMKPGAVKLYIKQNVETFLFRGADLMWPGVLTVNTREFKPNATATIYAHKALVKRYISTLNEERPQDKDNNKKEDAERAQDAEQD